MLRFGLGLFLLMVTSQLGHGNNVIQNLQIGNVRAKRALVTWNTTQEVVVTNVSHPLFWLTLYTDTGDEVFNRQLDEMRYELNDLDSSTRYDVCVAFSLDSTTRDANTTTCQSFETNDRFVAIFVGAFILVTFLLVVILDLVCKKDKDKVIKQSQEQILADGELNYKKAKTIPRASATPEGSAGIDNPGFPRDNDTPEGSEGMDNLGFRSLSMDDPGPMIIEHNQQIG
ncbi:uncharacterized protein [Antedon mediterranea]|uniref:uncharacterized protein n=1 Tax=Antedon mediterranea TaxID=105859 RepID=UPI003AF65F3C